MKPCRECGQPTAPTARSCPTCGILNPVQQWVAYPDGSHVTAREPAAGGYGAGMSALNHPPAPASQGPAGPSPYGPPPQPPVAPAPPSYGAPQENPGYGYGAAPAGPPPSYGAPQENPGYGYGSAPVGPPPQTYAPQGYGQPAYAPVPSHGGAVQGGTRLAYPLSLSFKLLALAPQISVADASGALLFYVKQKAFKLKEAVTVFADQEQTRPLYTIKADRVLDFSAQYEIADMAGNVLGSVKRQGRKSLWRSTYEISRGGQPLATLSEENPWVKVIDSLLKDIPVVGMFTGYFFNPSYLMARPGSGAPLFRLKKQPAFFEGKFSIEPQGPMSADEEALSVVSLLMVTLLERARG